MAKKKKEIEQENVSEETNENNVNQAKRMRDLNMMISAINKKAGKTIIGSAKDKDIAEKLKVKAIPTASLKVNEALGGGWPQGHYSILTGGPDSGKTFLMLETIALNMKTNPNFIAVWIESEHSLNDEPIDMFGIDKERFYFYDVGTEGGETALDYCIMFAKQGVDMIVINSLKCLTPSKEFKDNMGDANVALQARMNAKFTRIIVPTIAESGTTLVIIQHKSTDIGS